MTLIAVSQFLVLLGIGWTLYIVRRYLPAYLSKKAENLATKEDIKELTEIPERIRAQFFQVNTVHKVQFESEFQAYQALWVAAHNTVVAHLKWRSLTFETTDADIDGFYEAQLAFAVALVRYEPFIPESVWQEFKMLDERFVDVKIRYKLNPAKSLDTKEAERKVIDQLAGKCVAAIKLRLSQVLVV